MTIALEGVRALLDYDAARGVFTWRTGRPGVGRGSIAGSHHRQLGYTYIGIGGAKFLSHRLAWFYVHGEWPPETIDHINGDKADNRIANLRCVSKAINNQNRHRVRRDNRVGITGVSLTVEGRYRARISLDGNARLLGHFDTPDEAAAAYIKAKRLLHEGCTT